MLCRRLMLALVYYPGLATRGNDTVAQPHYDRPHVEFLLRLCVRIRDALFALDEELSSTPDCSSRTKNPPKSRSMPSTNPNDITRFGESKPASLREELQKVRTTRYDTLRLTMLTRDEESKLSKPRSNGAFGPYLFGHRERRLWACLYALDTAISPLSETGLVDLQMLKRIATFLRQAGVDTVNPDDILSQPHGGGVRSFKRTRDEPTKSLPKPQRPKLTA